ncbi:hypothetical protein BESB_009080 [Besnoitia besnoiti]|uniref:BRCA1-associated 2/ETP1 RRM domain-containing protein n=1 Tax=Besnoitia besnoiti TaxID=94643 RepID=A0A2A9MQ38_BESBE|nr:hypothetical protein BESB_009080 [Besnoitia besnoiti]PFH38566.1 hypothetical protein BESB_009080 [Besnoitia besnoiti]
MEACTSPCVSDSAVAPDHRSAISLPHSQSCCDATFFSIFFSTPAGTPPLTGLGASSLPLSGGIFKPHSNPSPSLSPTVSPFPPNCQGVCTATSSPGPPPPAAPSFAASLLTRDVSFWCGNPAIERLSGTLRYFLTPSQATAERLLRNLPASVAPSHAFLSVGAATTAAESREPATGDFSPSCRPSAPSRDGSAGLGPSGLAQKQKCICCGCDVWQWLREECVLVAPRVPSYISPAEFCDFLAPYNRRMLQAKVLHGPTTAEYLILLHCSRLTAIEAIAAFNGVPLFDGDTAVCELRIVKEISLDPSSPPSKKNAAESAKTTTPAFPPRSTPPVPCVPRGQLSGSQSSALALLSPRLAASPPGSDTGKELLRTPRPSESQPALLDALGEAPRAASARKKNSPRSVRAAGDGPGGEGAGELPAGRDGTSIAAPLEPSPLLRPVEEPADPLVGAGGGNSGKASLGDREGSHPPQSAWPQEPCGALQFLLQRRQEDTQQQEFCAVCLERVQIPLTPSSPALAATASPQPVAALPTKDAREEETQRNQAAAGAPASAPSVACSALSLAETAGGDGGRSKSPAALWGLPWH